MNAGQVNVRSFLSAIRETSRPESLQICADILHKHPDTQSVRHLARKVFPMYSGQRELLDLYRTTASCLVRDPAEESRQLFLRELRCRNGEPLTAGLLPYLLQTLLENLHVLPAGEAKAYARE